MVDTEEINLEISRRKLKWTAGLNPIAILSDEEKKRLCGTEFLPEETFRKIPRKIIKKFSLATSFDWRNYNGMNWMTSVKSQIGGSCWDFSAVGCVEALFKIKKNLPNQEIDLSEQELISCGYNADYSDPRKTSMSPVSALQYIRDFGIVSENCFPINQDFFYDIPCNPCNDYYVPYTHKIQGYSSVEIENWKDALLDGPITVVLNVHSDFFYYRSGIYSQTIDNFVGWHALILCGYNDAERYWILKNSWGVGWGENGYCRMDYDTANNLLWWPIQPSGPLWPEETPPVPPKPISIKFYKLSYPNDSYANYRVSITATVKNYVDPFGVKIPGSAKLDLLDRDTSQILDSDEYYLNGGKIRSFRFRLTMPYSIELPTRILRLRLNLYQDNSFSEAKDIDINLKEGIGHLILPVLYPANASYNQRFKIYVTLSNTSIYRDSCFFRIVDNDTGGILGTAYQYTIYPGRERQGYRYIKMPNKNLNFRVEVGHKEGRNYIVEEISPVYAIQLI